MQNKNIHPPKTAKWFLNRFLSIYSGNPALGDLDEEFYLICDEKDTGYARRWYFRQVLKSIPLFIKFSIYWRYSMIKNYFITSFRNIVRHKGFSFINILGLAMGLACFLLIFLWVQDEMSYDRFHKNADNIYRINSHNYLSDRDMHTPETPLPLGLTLENEYPEVTNSTKILGDWTSWQVSYGDKMFLNDRFVCAEPSFLEMFDYPLLKGNPKTALSETFSIIMTEKMAFKYFGDEDPIGKDIKIYNNSYKVTGILKEIPRNSHLQFDAVFPFSYWRDVRRTDLGDWDQTWAKTFIQIRDNSSSSDLNKKISGIVKKKEPGLNMDIYLQPLTEIHLYSDFSHEFWGMGKKVNNVYIFSLTAFFILIIACINFMNLSTARSDKRAKEIGIRKVAGAYRKDIIRQFFCEAVFISFIALAFAVFLAVLFLPVINSLSGKELSLSIWENLSFFTFLIAVTLFTGILSGSYPALLLSSFKPVNVIKGIRSSGGRAGKNLRKVLVSVQFIFTSVLIILTFTIYSQLRYISNKDVGFDKDNIVYFDAYSGFRTNYRAAKNELLQNPDILSVTKSRWTIFAGGGTNEINWEGKNPGDNIYMYQLPVDYDYVKTFKIKMTEGRFFSEKFTTDTSNYILNETAVRVAGLKDPVGKKFSCMGNEGKIIGVIKDFHHQSFRQEIEPSFFRFSNNRNNVCVKIRPGNVSATVKFLESIWKKYAPNYALEYRFLDESMDRWYKKDRQKNRLLGYFSILAIFISCLGLFGLALFEVEKRTREIGIRKVLGSSVTGIVYILMKDFAVLIISANIIAVPFAYLAVNRWLQDFIYKIEPGLGIFLLSGFITFIISIITISYQAAKAAVSNPVNALKHE